MHTLLLSLLVPLATAADHPCDAAFPDACVDPSTTVDSNATILPGARVGPDMAVGDAVIASRAVLDGRDDGESAQPVGDGTVIGRRTVIGPDASIGEDVEFGRAVVAGRDLIAGDGSLVGYASQLGDGVTLGPNAAVGSLVTLHDGAEVNGVVARSASIGENAVVEGVVGPGTVVGEDAVVEGRVRKDVTLADGVTVQIGSTVGRGAVLGHGTRLETGARVASGAMVPACSRLGAGDRVRRGQQWQGAMVDGCFDPDAFSPHAITTSASGSAAISAVATDPATGDVYVVGSFLGEARFEGVTLTSTDPLEQSDLFIAAYQGDGTLRWARSYSDSDTTSGSELAYYNGSIYVAGTVQGTLNLDGQSISNEDVKADIFVARLDASDGDRIWMREINTGTTSNSNRVNDIAVTANGVYIVGAFNNTVTFVGSGGLSMTPFQFGGNNDGFFARMDLGTGHWHRVRQIGGSSLDWLNAVTPLPNGNIAVGGLISGPLATGSTRLFSGVSSTDGLDGLVLVLNSSGSVVSSRHVSGPGTDQVRALSAAGSRLVALVEYSNTLTFGSSTINGHSSNAPGVLEMTTSATAVRAHEIGGDFQVRGAGIETDGSNVVVAGYVAGSGTATTFGPFSVGLRQSFVASLDLGSRDWQWLESSTSVNNPPILSLASHTYNGQLGYIVGGRYRGETTYGSTTFNSDNLQEGFWLPIGADGSW